ncbi:unnamed protein product [Choristocarpus tenellus]
MTVQVVLPQMDIHVHGIITEGAEAIITPDALRFVGFLHNTFEQRRQFLLQTRKNRQKDFDSGCFPDFLMETAHIRSDPTWRVAPPPHDLADRRVEITGPVDRKMVINGLNSGASTYMADFEDSSSPTWTNMVEGQVNLRDAVRGTIEYVQPGSGKIYSLRGKKRAVLLVRPRGWHLDEAHITVNGRPMSGALFDFGMYFFHNVYALLKAGSGPYFYIAKIESYLEARLWNDVFVASQQVLGVPTGTIRATALLETITAAFEMEEVLYELREHSAGLNCGRWDYIFSYIKKMRVHSKKVTPDRCFLTMEIPSMQAYVKLLINTCHRRGAHAMGGMAAQIPVKNNPKLAAQALDGVRKDKLREVEAGHDGTWVAHPALVEVAMDIFNQHMPQANQIHFVPECSVTAEDLLMIPTEGNITSEGLRENVDVCLVYVESWLRGNGCIPVNFKMEDAATAEISRVQVWQWVHHGAKTVNGEVVTASLVHKLMAEAVERHCAVLRGPKATAGTEVEKAQGQTGKFTLAGKLVVDMMTAPELDDFLTTVAYPHIVNVSHCCL